MGVDFYACDECGETFPDCSDYDRCEACNAIFCRDCMYGVFDGDEDTGEEASCSICRYEVMTDGNLVEFLLELLGITREHAETKYREAYPLYEDQEDSDEEESDDD